MQMRRLAACLAIVLGAAGADNAEAVIFDIAWTGNQATLEGRLAFDDSLLGTGIIDGTQIDQLVFEVFSGGESLGTASLGGGDPNLTLLFDTDAERFVVGGPAVQSWNVGGNVGFESIFQRVRRQRPWDGMR